MENQSWKRFVASENLGPLRAANKVVASWEFCRERQAAPFKKMPARMLTKEQFQARQRLHAKLVQLVRQKVSQLTERSLWKESVFVLTDDEGNVLWYDGKQTELEVSSSVKLEKAVSASRTAIKQTGKRKWSSYATAIVDGRDDLLGVLDVSIQRASFLPQCRAISQLIAQCVTNQLVREELDKTRYLLQYAADTLTDKVICDEQYRIVHIPSGYRSESWLKIGADMPQVLSGRNISSDMQTLYRDKQPVGIGYRLFNQESAKEKLFYAGISSRNQRYNEFLTQVINVADSDVPVHVFGETGCGKERIVEMLHFNHPRCRKGKLVRVNCGSVSESLLESELFGYAPGAFTGAKAKGHHGKIRQADGGTLFLDEIDSMSLRMQTALLRVIEDKQVSPVGAVSDISVSFRLVTASNQDLKELVAGGTFREDLFYRIYVLPLLVPPLRERPEDFQELVAEFCRQKDWSISWQEQICRVSREYEWLGNIREFRNFLERLRLSYPHQCPSVNQMRQLIEMGQLSVASSEAGHDDDEKRRIMTALQENTYHVSQTARALNLSRSTLYRKMKKYAIKR